ncbi:barstar family protein [Stenotrophomonas sp. ISL-67]|uniref:barstar family protein n=1 Tax=Stenotrophomonas sp. ISL-67 TaxID=2819171 RepID=UPI001BE7599C|nr:barstar family protein [Stenotrophomonas sp. ISL-67]MBT2766370.1 barstar family protein [Stenotrophomonas sp. ISL-67]
MTTHDSLVLMLAGSAINDIPSFYAEINRVFMADEDWQLGHSLDALDDMLYGGYGVLAGHESAKVIWQDMEHTRSALGVDATRAWLQGKLAGSGKFNEANIAAQLKALDAGEGQTYFQIVMEIFAAHLRIQLEGR